MKRSYGSLESAFVDDDFAVKKHKPDLSVFSYLPAELLVQIISLVALDWLYISKEWHQIALNNLLSDSRIKPTNESLLTVTRLDYLAAVKLHVKSGCISSDGLNAAFLYAGTHRYLDIVNYLLEETADVSPNSLTLALNTATLQGDYQFVKRLVRDKRLDPSKSHALIMAASCGHYNIVKLLMKDKRIDPSIDDNIVVIRAVSNGHYKIVKKLLKDSRVDPSAGENVAIVEAAATSYKVVKLLLKDKRVDPSARGNWALQRAIESSQYKTVKLLMKDPRVNPSDDGLLNRTPIILAKENYQILKFLLKDPRSDPTVADHELIRHAVHAARLDIVKLLLQDPRTDPTGPRPVTPSRLYQSPTTIDIACRRNNMSVLELLLADPRVDFARWSSNAIDRAIEFGHFNIALAVLKMPAVTIDRAQFETISHTIRHATWPLVRPVPPELLDLLALKTEGNSSQDCTL